MPFIKANGVPGKVFVPDEKTCGQKKHPCPDCYYCQHCEDGRCSQCRKIKGCVPKD